MKKILFIMAVLVSFVSCTNNQKHETYSGTSITEQDSIENTSSKQEENYSNSSYSSTSRSGHNSMDADDKEYWESVNREKALRDRGMDRAADIERKARIEYLQGGGYHSKDGGSQVHFQGSKEQEDQLRQMDEMGW